MRLYVIISIEYARMIYVTRHNKLSDLIMYIVHIVHLQSMSKILSPKSYFLIIRWTNILDLPITKYDYVNRYFDSLIIDSELVGIVMALWITVNSKSSGFYKINILISYYIEKMNFQSYI